MKIWKAEQVEQLPSQALLQVPRSVDALKVDLARQKTIESPDATKPTMSQGY